jgi:hypothetical protein
MISQKRSRDSEKRAQDDNRTVLRSLRSFQSWGIIKPSGSAPAPSACSTPGPLPQASFTTLKP